LFKDITGVSMKDYTRCDKTTYEELIYTLHYDPNTGVFTHLTLVGNKVRFRPDDIGGTQRSDGYVWITTRQGSEQASRLAWLYMTGGYPPAGYIVDHKDTVKFNNIWDNLRLATHSQNCQNSGGNINKSTGVKGVTIAYSTIGKKNYVAQVKAGGKITFLKTFSSLKEASKAVVVARNLHHGEFANHE
jgi:hypothetical protein